MGSFLAKLFTFNVIDDNKTIVDPDQPEIPLVIMQIPVDIQEGQGFFVKNITVLKDGSKVYHIENNDFIFATV